jgi:hypothetical protein
MSDCRRLPSPGEPGTSTLEESAGSDSLDGALDDILRRLEREIARMDDEIRAAERGEADTAAAGSRARLAELHRASNTLIGRYVVLRRLREAADFPDLMRTLREVLESLVGLASFAVYWRESPEDDSLLLCTVEPEETATSRSVRVGDGPVGEVAGRREPWVVRPGERKFTIPATPIGWFPLRHRGQPRGGIAVFEVLSHKKGFEPRDLDLLELISTHAAGAIESACAAARRDLPAATTAEIIARIGDGRRP